MLKLIICLMCGFVLAALTLQLRQQHVDLKYQANQLHNRIEQQQAKLWNQQLQIGIYTAPNAIANTIGHLDLKLVPRSPLPPEAANWMEQQQANPDAE